MSHAKNLSELLLALHAGSHETDMQGFMSNGLAVLKRQIRFDGAWLGMRSADDDGRHIHFSYIEGMPADMTRLWRSMCESDKRALPLLTHAGSRTAIFDAAAIRRLGEGPQWLSRASGSHNVLCSESTNERLGHRIFLCLCRRDEHDIFSEDERYLKELVMPHLQCAIANNRDANLRRVALQSARAGKHWAVVDLLGAVHTAEPCFIETLERSWPGWDGPLLPAPLRARFAEPTERWLTRGLAFEAQWVGDLALVSVRSAGDVFDLLSPREQEVAEAFGTGLSYKAVAQLLEIAPTTVRHHLRNVYVKLGVDNKAAIIRLVNRETAQEGPSFI